MANIKQIKLPNNTTYDLKDESGSLSSHWHHDEDLKPLISKTYASTSYYASANNWANATWYFMSIKPDSWYKPFRVKLKVHSFCPSYSTHESYTWCTLTGRQNSIAYINWNERNNSAHSYLTYYPLTQAGFNAGYGHAIGISIYNADNRTSSAYYRTFEVDYYECENCTVTILDTPVKWANWTGTGTTNYGTLGSFNAVDRGLQETGDANSQGQYLFCYNTSFFKSAVVAESLACGDINGYCQVVEGATFDITYPLLWVNAEVAANGTNYANTFLMHYDRNLANVKSGFNSSPRKIIYLVLSISGITATVDGQIITDTLPTTEDGKYYMKIGRMGNQSTGQNYFIFLPDHPIYHYSNGAIREFVQDAGSVNGHTVAKDVPADAVFTDTTYESKQEAQGGTDLSLVTTGEKYVWNHNAVVNDGTLTIKQNGTSQGTFTANQSGNSTIELTDTTYESKTEASGGTDLSLVTTGDKWNWNRTFPFKPGLEVASLDDLVGLMDYSFDKRCFSGVIKITTNIGIGVTGWRRILAIAQNAVNNGTYDIGMFCMFFPADTSDFVNYALIDGKTTGNYSVSKTGQFVTNIFEKTVQITTAGNGQLNLGNNLASGVTGKSRGRLVIFSDTDTYYSDIRTTGLSDNRRLLCPNKSGTIAVTSDIVDEKIKVTRETNGGSVFYPISTTRWSTTAGNVNGITGGLKVGIWAADSELDLLASGGGTLVTLNSQWLRFETNNGGIDNGTAQRLRLSASDESNYYVDLGVKDSEWCFAPAVTKKLRLGSASYLWTTVYAQTGSINTSDRNEKKDIVPLDESAKDFIMALNPVSYKFKDGESGRTHYGMIAQDVEQEMAELGMTAMDFAGFCKDQKTVPYTEEKDGRQIQKDMPVEGEYTYGLRYEEFMAPAIKTIQLLQNQVDTQQQEIDELKQQLAEIKAMLNGGN